MLLSLLQLLAGLVVLTLGAELLVRGAAALALRIGLSPLAVGMTIVAFGTSAPELVVCVKASLADQAGMALGNIVGSNIFNLAAVLGLVALVRPVGCQASIVRREVPAMIGVALLLALFVFAFAAPGAQGAPGHLVRWEGAVLLALLVVHVVIALTLAKGEQPAVHEEFARDVVSLPREANAPRAASKWWLNAALVALGLLMLGGGAELLVSAAVSIARAQGVSDLVIGLTIVGAGTSLPELATSVVAAWRGESDIAIGNVLGSNIFNVLGILGLTVVISPLEVEASVLQRDLPVLVMLSLACWPIARSGHVISRWEGAGLLAAYVSYIVYVLLGAS